MSEIHRPETHVLLVICPPGGSEDVLFRSVVSHLIKGLGESAREAFQIDLLLHLHTAGVFRCRSYSEINQHMNPLIDEHRRGLALQSALDQIGLPTRVHTAIHMENIAEPFIRRRAIEQLEHGQTIIFVAGTGNPFFSTDTTAALRANEIGAEVILKATKVDGIYTADPFKDPKATKYDRISYTDALAQRLSVMDSTAFSLCMDNKMPIIVFDMMKNGNIKKAVLGQAIGTLVTV